MSPSAVRLVDEPFGCELRAERPFGCEPVERQRRMGGRPPACRGLRPGGKTEDMEIGNGYWNDRHVARGVLTLVASCST